MNLIPVLILVVSIAVAAPSSIGTAKTKKINLLRYENDNSGTGSYKFSYEQSDGQKHQQQGELKNEGREGAFVAVKGSYTWFSPEGTEYVINYVADENGFQQTVEETPGGPGDIPLDVLYSLLSK